MDNFTPREIVQYLGKYIVGQTEAKKTVAIAFRNRYRRMCVKQELQEEIIPKNILMIGSTGVGKTEMARRIAKLMKSPFLKVEASKYTQVGYVGRDVESIIRDIMEVSISLVSKEMKEKSYKEAEKRTEEILLQKIINPSGVKEDAVKTPQVGIQEAATQQENTSSSSTHSPSQETVEKFRKMLKAGKLEDREIELSIRNPKPKIDVMGVGGFPNIDEGSLGELFSNMMPNKTTKRNMKVSQARGIILAQELENLIDRFELIEESKKRVETQGVIFIDEIDKICSDSDFGKSSSDVSKEGVQRDLLPIIEGSEVNTKYGVIKTDHILFIAAGAFHMAKPSDLIPELQGRFPIRVELQNLTAQDFVEILNNKNSSIIHQYEQLLKIDGVNMSINKEGIERLAELAFEVNNNVQDIGARRLHTIMEKLLADLLFGAPDIVGTTEIGKEYVDDKLKAISRNIDLSKYIL